MTKEQFAARLKQACASVISAEQELTEIDSKFGDADHGLTMTKIAKAISDAVDQSDGGIQAMLDDAATAVMSLNGGSAVPLWNTWLDGMQEAAPEGEEIDVPGLQAVFAQALEELNDMSGAKVGDKTMMDALSPASEAVAAYAGADEAGLFAGLASFIDEAVSGNAIQTSPAKTPAEALASYIAQLISKAGLLALSFLVILLVWFLVGHILDLTFHLPILSAVNFAGGLALGLLKAALLVIVLVWLGQLAGWIPAQPDTPLLSLFTLRSLGQLLNQLLV